MAGHRQLTRKIGDSEFCALGYGLMGLSTAYGKVGSDEERFKILDAIYESGCNFWDTADVYGDSEDLLGKWFKLHPERRSKIFLSSKFAHRGGPDPRTRYVDSSPEYVREAIEKTLSRLGVEYLDMYYCHRVDKKTPIEKTVQAMVQLKNEGKIKHLGLSEISSATLRRAHKIHPISAVQVEYSPFFLDIENEKGTDLLKTCRELGVKVVAYSPLGRGILTGQIKGPEDFEAGDFRSFLPRFSKENFPKILHLVSRLESMSKAKSCTPGQLSLAFLLAQGDDIIPIPGTKKIKYFEENMGSLDVELSKEEVAEIRKICEEVQFEGGRYPEGMTSSLFGDTPELQE